MASLKYSANSSLQTVTLGSAYTSGSGSMSLTTGHGARLPSSGDFWLAYDNGAGTVRLFKVTARSTDTLTVTADATEGSGDGNISSGETLRWALTAAALDQLKADIVASGAMVLLQTQTASSSASLNFTSCISSTYDTYAIVLVSVKPATNNAKLRMRVSTDNGSSWISTSTYHWGLHRFNHGGSAPHGSLTDTSITLNNGQGNTSTLPGFSATLQLTDPAGYCAISGHGSGYLGGSNPDGYVIEAYENTGNINAFQFYEDSGNIASGIIRVYGIAK